VSPNGKDSNGGTLGDPWATFDKAMSILLPGDTLYLEDGTYNQTLNVQVSGTADNYITIKALHDGQATVEYGVLACIIDGVSYIEIDGIVFKDNGGSGSGNVVNIGGSNNIILRRVSAYNAGLHANEIVGSGSKNILLEDCAASGTWNVSYLAIDMNTCSNVTIRRCFTYNIDPGIILYESDHSLVENSIAMTPSTVGDDSTTGGTRWAMGANDTYDAHANYDTFLGNISFGNAIGYTFEGGFTSTNHIGGQMNQINFLDNVSINATRNYGITIENDVGGTISNNTFALTRTDLPDDGDWSGLAFFQRWMSDSNISVSFYNNSLVGNGNPNLNGLVVDTTGYTVNDGNTNGTVSVTNTYNNYDGIASGANYSGEASQGRGEQTLNPNYNTVTYGYGAYLMDPSNLGGSGASGTGATFYGYNNANGATFTPANNIGSNIIYEYVNGVLTSTPLWPWPMEDRIFAELNVSPTWEIYGGIWSTLDGIYPGDITVPSPPAPISSNLVFAINAGGEWYKSQSGTVYNADIDYSGGGAGATTAVITGTSDSTLYQSERYGNFSYSIPLANGNYTVTLRFAEIYWNAAGQRIFNVSMQGTQVISNLDLFALVGENAAYDATIPVSVTNGILNIKFSSIQDYACVSAIEISFQTRRHIPRIVD
jgi:hypothetical protein